MKRVVGDMEQNDDMTFDFLWDAEKFPFFSLEKWGRGFPRSYPYIWICDLSLYILFI